MILWESGKCKFRNFYITQKRCCANWAGARRGLYRSRIKTRCHRPDVQRPDVQRPDVKAPMPKRPDVIQIWLKELDRKQSEKEKAGLKDPMRRSLDSRAGKRERTLDWKRARTLDWKRARTLDWERAQTQDWTRRWTKSWEEKSLDNRVGESHRNWTAKGCQENSACQPHHPLQVSTRSRALHLQLQASALIPSLFNNHSNIHLFSHHW